MVEVGKYINIKTGNEYFVLDFAVNATNEQDGQDMVIYTLAETAHYPTRKNYVREIEEFEVKFKKVED